MGAFDAIPGSMRPPSARHLKPGVKPPTEVDILLQASGRLLLCGVNSVRPAPCLVIDFLIPLLDQFCHHYCLSHSEFRWPPVSLSNEILALRSERAHVSSQVTPAYPAAKFHAASH
jgi:hypothetical protein